MELGPHVGTWRQARTPRNQLDQERRSAIEARDAQAPRSLTRPRASSPRVRRRRMPASARRRRERRCAAGGGATGQRRAQSPCEYPGRIPLIPLRSVTQ